MIQTVDTICKWTGGASLLLMALSMLWVVGRTIIDRDYLEGPPLGLDVGTFGLIASAIVWGAMHFVVGL